jgi:hypothetical protein
MFPESESPGIHHHLWRRVPRQVEDPKRDKALASSIQAARGLLQNEQDIRVWMLMQGTGSCRHETQDNFCCMSYCVSSRTSFWLSAPEVDIVQDALLGGRIRVNVPLQEIEYR